MSTLMAPTESNEHSASPMANRRQFVRYRCAPATIGKICKADSHNFETVWVLDLSRSGVGLLLSQSLPKTQKLVLQITSPSDNQKYEFPARVVHSTPQLTGGEWVVGLEFEMPLTDEQLDRLLGLE